MPTTHFASPERDGPDEIARQAECFDALPFIQQMVDFIPNIFLVLNKNRQIVFANGTLLKLLGIHDNKNILGLRPGEAISCVNAKRSVSGCGTAEGCAHCGAVQAILHSQDGMHDIQECRIIGENNTPYDLRVWAAPYTHKGDVYTIFAIRDISDEKRRNALERIFFHDIMNTATGIQGASALINDASQEELEEYVEMIQSSASTLVEEINAQRDILSAENGELLTRDGVATARDILEQVAAIYRVNASRCGKKLDISPNSSQAVVVCDLALLKRVVGNMAKNALEATYEAQTVLLGSDDTSEGIRFWVRNPVFIPQEVQLQIFQRSFSTKGAGRGLGTYSMKLLGEKYLHGKVSFSSTPDTGTTFQIIIPRPPEA